VDLDKLIEAGRIAKRVGRRLPGKVHQAVRACFVAEAA